MYPHLWLNMTQVVDEAHRLKNYKSKLYTKLQEYNADNKLLLTGTPIQNDTTEFWSILSFIDNKTFGNRLEFEVNQSLMVSLLFTPFVGEIWCASKQGASG